MTPVDRGDQLGRRVVVRYRRPAGEQPPLTDVVGMVTAADDTGLTVESRSGAVRVRRSDIVVVKEVPPKPVRRGRPHAAISTADLERVMADGWRAIEEEWLGDWMLRASSGFTRRANSVLPLGDPGTSPEAAVEQLEQWYAARGLPPQVHLDLPPSENAGDDPLGALLGDRGYRVVAPTLVMTGASADVRPPGPDEAEVHVTPSLEPQWLDAYAEQRPTLPGVTERLLTGSPGRLFASTAVPSGARTAVARLSVHPGWVGLQALWVRPASRGEGLARALVHAAGVVARQHGAPSMYLQVETENDAAIRLYASEGFRPHHTYCYLVREP